jgi:hypothetical protein
MSPCNNLPQSNGVIAHEGIIRLIGPPRQVGRKVIPTNIDLLDTAIATIVSSMGNGPDRMR